GEFKAGKSTLINALIGRTVAAADVFELTQVVCRVVPVDPDAHEYVELRSRDHSRSPVLLDCDTFVAQALARQLGDYELAVVYIRSDLGVVLVDTPGLGATLKNELEALGALGTTDIALCAIDGESLGGGRDAATIARIREIDLPFICVLTKADTFAPDELKLVVDYISENLGVPHEQIFPVSALACLSGRDEIGVNRLRQYLKTEVATSGITLRKQALLAQARDVATAYGVCISGVSGALDTVLRDVDEYAASLDQMAVTVTNDLCASLAAMLRERLRLAIEETGNRRGGAPLTEADFLEVVRVAFADETEQEFISHLSKQLDERFQHEWVEGFKEQLSFLQTNLSAMKSDANEAAIRDVEKMIRTERRREEAVSEAASSAWSGIAVATGTTVAIAATAHVLTVLTLIPGGLFAVPFLLNAWNKMQKADDVDGESNPDDLRKAIEQWRETVISDVLEYLHPRMLELNRDVAAKAAKNYATKTPNWPLTLPELHQLRSEALALHGELKISMGHNLI
ncbi:dynamin family protein, partial [Armatimonas sp.]|uniref:dynamin family protein n=1 Tax=Armatimonas sp. TaxID=1872638 RepID=UPI003753849A